MSLLAKFLIKRIVDQFCLGRKAYFNNSLFVNTPNTLLPGFEARFKTKTLFEYDKQKILNVE